MSINYDNLGTRVIDGEVAFVGLPKQSETGVDQNPYLQLQQELNVARELRNPEAFQKGMSKLIKLIKREATDNPDTADRALLNTLFEWAQAVPFVDDTLLNRLITPDNPSFKSNIKDGSERGGRLVLPLGPDSGDASFAEGIIGKLNTWVQARAGDHLRVGSAPGIVDHGQSYLQAVTTIRSITGK